MQMSLRSSDHQRRCQLTITHFLIYCNNKINSVIGLEQNIAIVRKIKNLMNGQMHVFSDSILKILVATTSHPSIHHLSIWVAGRLEPIQADWQEAGYMNMLPKNHWANTKMKIIYPYGQFRVHSSSDKAVGENPHKHGENLQIPHRKIPNR